MNLWSVTTLAKLALGESQGLVNWKINGTAGTAFDRFDILSAYVRDGDREGAIKFLRDAPYQATKKAAARGTEIHAAAEQFALGQTPDVDDRILPYVQQYRRFLEDHRPQFIMAEAPVYNVTHGYAGTCDGIMVLQDRRLVFDYKTTEHGPDAVTDTGRPKLRPPFPEVALQLVAYRRAELVGVLSEQRYSSGRRYYVYDPDAHHEPMPETDGAVCIVISPHDYMVVPVRTDDTVWNAWRHVIETARWQEFTSRNVFGPLITPERKAA